VTVLTCRDDDQAKVLAYLLSGTPLAGTTRSYRSASNGSTSAAPTTSPTQRNQSWNETPQRKLLKCIIAAMHKEGDHGLPLVARFKKLVPTYQSFFDRPLSDEAIANRGDCAWRYPNENPGTNPKLRMYWQLAQNIVSDDDVEDTALAPQDPDKAAARVGTA
jgi:hypothetical protein